MCRNSRENAWCLKAVLRIFELVSGLRVNFHKSCLLGLNLEVEEVEAVAHFLCCKLGELPFKFLGIPIGANPRLSVTWKPVVKRMRDRLSSWRSRQLSIGGRVTLINSMLASLPLYYLSFFKVPKVVLKEMVQIQHNFLWGGASGTRKMAWVRWSKVCVSKESGGLGIRNMELFNLSLLGKWRWRLKEETNGEWASLLKRLYGDMGTLKMKQASIWWKDIQKVGTGNEPSLRWFDDEIKIKIGNGKVASFWHDVWCCPNKLKDLFPHLFQIAGNKDSTVASVACSQNSSGRWGLSWSRELSAAEQSDANLLTDMLAPITLDSDVDDRWVWPKDKSNKYKVKSTYSYLISRNVEVETDEENKTVLKRLWKSAAPSKHLVFVWRLLVGGLPTRFELKRRGVLDQDQLCLCALCEEEEEDSMHLFLGCRMATQVWQQLYQWCGVDSHDSRNFRSHFLQNAVKIQHKKWKKFSSLPWIAVVWVVWINRNNVVFKEARINVNNMVQHIKRLVWGWFVQKVDKNSTHSLDSWCNGSLRELFLDVNYVSLELINGFGTPCTIL